MSASEQTYLIAMGGNMPSEIGSPAETLSAAINDINSLATAPAEVSRFFETPCFPAGAGPDYVNAAIRLRSKLTPRQLLDALHEIESKYGRLRVERWGQRTLDLDLIAADACILPSLETYQTWQTLPLDDQEKFAPNELILPHPRLAERAFVLVPLADIAGDWEHPVLKLNIKQMLDRLAEPEKASVKPL